MSYPPAKVDACENEKQFEIDWRRSSACQRKITPRWESVLQHKKICSQAIPRMRGALGKATFFQSGGGPPHSTTLRAVCCHRKRGSVLECASPLALWLCRTGCLKMKLVTRTKSRTESSAVISSLPQPGTATQTLVAATQLLPIIGQNGHFPSGTNRNQARDFSFGRTIRRDELLLPIIGRVPIQEFPHRLCHPRPNRPRFFTCKCLSIKGPQTRTHLNQARKFMHPTRAESPQCYSPACRAGYIQNGFLPVCRTGTNRLNQNEKPDGNKVGTDWNKPKQTGTNRK